MYRRRGRDGLDLHRRQHEDADSQREHEQDRRNLRPAIGTALARKIAMIPKRTKSAPERTRRLEYPSIGCPAPGDRATESRRPPHRRRGACRPTSPPRSASHRDRRRPARSGSAPRIRGTARTARPGPARAPPPGRLRDRGRRVRGPPPAAAAAGGGGSGGAVRRRTAKHWPHQSASSPTSAPQVGHRRSGWLTRAAYPRSPREREHPDSTAAATQPASRAAIPARYVRAATRALPAVPIAQARSGSPSRVPTASATTRSV